MPCATDKKLPTRAERGHIKQSPEELAALIQLQPRAIQKISQLLAEKPGSYFRIFIQGFGWGGPRLGIAQDERKDDDIEIKKDNVHIVITPKELPYVLSRGGVRVDHADSGWSGGFYVSRIYATSCS